MKDLTTVTRLHLPTFGALLGALLVAPLACGGSTPAPETPASATAASTDSAPAATETKPDREKLVAHLRNHVKYPVTRADLLRACADTPEFTAAEKSWFASRVPDRTYASADEVLGVVNP